MSNYDNPFGCGLSRETGLEHYRIGPSRRPAVPLVVNPDIVPVIDGVGVVFDPTANDQGTGLFIFQLQGASYTPGTPVVTPGGGLLTVDPDRKTVNYLECGAATPDSSSYTVRDVNNAEGTG